MTSSLGATAQAAPKKDFDIAWTIYVGWMPWPYAAEAGIVKKWGDKYGINIKVTQINDYVESINQYTAGKFDGVTVTNMDSLTVPAAGGVDTSAIVLGDFSNGNDGIVLKNGKDVKALKGRSVKLVEFTVSHYMLARALEMNGMTEKDIKTVNTSDSDIAAVFASDANAAVVTWNPPLQQVRNAKGAAMVFDSSKIPGEIMDLLVIKSKAPDTLKKALTGAWYEVMKVMSDKGKGANDAIEYMAKFSSATVPEFKAQLATTSMFYGAAEAAAFASGPEAKKTMDQIRTFTFAKGLFGKGAKSKDFVGISFPDGTVLGDKNNVKLRFDATYMKMAAEGKL